MENKEKIIKYLKEIDDWVLAGKIRSIETKFGWIGFRGDRDTRSLVQAGVLERRLNGKFAEVRYKRDRITLPPSRPQKQARLI